MWKSGRMRAMTKVQQRHATIICRQTSRPGILRLRTSVAKLSRRRNKLPPGLFVVRQMIAEMWMQHFVDTHLIQPVAHAYSEMADNVISCKGANSLQAEGPRPDLPPPALAPCWDFVIQPCYPDRGHNDGKSQRKDVSATRSPRRGQMFRRRKVGYRFPGHEKVRYVCHLFR